MTPKPYRPHDPGNDYYDRGIYLITLVTRERQQVLGSLNNDIKHSAVNLSAIGTEVMKFWEQIPSINSTKGRQISVLASICMPDHFHGVIEVKERMKVPLGEIIRGFKAGCTMAWRNVQRPSMVAPHHLGQTPCSDNEWLKHLSKKQRQAYYSLLPLSQQPLFDDNFDDTICLTDPLTGAFDQRHTKAMINYVVDNPHRAIIRKTRPNFMQLCLHITIEGRDYAAFGNLFLLRWSRKVQIFCHRRARLYQLTEKERITHGYTYQASPTIETRVPYEETEAYNKDHDLWYKMVMQGQTVIVTPGISKGELLMKKECLSNGIPLIHLQKEPIDKYWKPEQERFYAAANGSLLILAPWHADKIGEVRGVPSCSDYSQFHNLNSLAEEICNAEMSRLCIKSS